MRACASGTNKRCLPSTWCCWDWSLHLRGTPSCDRTSLDNWADTSPRVVYQHHSIGRSIKHIMSVLLYVGNGFEQTLREWQPEKNDSGLYRTGLGLRDGEGHRSGGECCDVGSRLGLVDLVKVECCASRDGAGLQAVPTLRGEAGISLRLAIPFSRAPPVIMGSTHHHPILLCFIPLVASFTRGGDDGAHLGVHSTGAGAQQTCDLPGASLAAACRALGQPERCDLGKRGRFDRSGCFIPDQSAHPPPGIAWRCAESESGLLVSVQALTPVI